MSFPASAGYGNVPNGVIIPTIFSKKILLNLKKVAVADEITNTEYQGEIEQYGDTVRIVKQPNVTVRPYTRGMNLTSQDLIDEDLTLTIDQANYYQFEMDMIDLRQEHVAYEDAAADSAAYNLKDTYDSNILSYISTQTASANNLGAVTVGYGAGNSFTPLDLLARFARTLDDNNVPSEDRWFVGSPAFYEALQREDSKFVEAQIIGSAQSPIVSKTLAMSLMPHGFKMYKSNNLPSSGTVMLAGHKGAVATAAGLTEAETLPNPTKFGQIYRGLHVFGRKDLRPIALTKATVTIGDV